MHSSTRTGVFLLAVFWLVAQLEAGTIPGRWEKVDALSKGTAVQISLNSGEKLGCILKGVKSDSLTVIDGEGTERSLPKSAITSIEGVEKHSDRMWDGALIGGAIGAVAGGAAGYMTEEGRAGYSAALFGGIGAGIGLAVDAAVKSNQVYYKAPK
ncbi:MAG TPA: hypothetical protein VMY18_05575 [Acidobacteriota bacterium]|jgi:hypothetical protein|nr:hypothetical protein [Acidobacteriota bacterium]